MKVEVGKDAKSERAKSYMLEHPKVAYSTLMNALSGLENLEGDIRKLRGYKNVYRLSAPPFRIIFKYDKVNSIVLVTGFDTSEEAGGNNENTDN